MKIVPHEGHCEICGKKLFVDKDIPPVAIPLAKKVDKWCSMQDYCRYAETVEQSDSECNTCITHCNFEFKPEGEGED
jgi:hypothetical protein